jgi:hypothetical protein
VIVDSTDVRVQLSGQIIHQQLKASICNQEQHHFCSHSLNSNIMEKGTIEKIRIISNQQMVLSDIFGQEFCFPHTVEIEFEPAPKDAQAILKAINIYIGSIEGYAHITEYLGFKVYNYHSTNGNVKPGDSFKLPDYPITILYQEMPIGSPIATIMSGYISFSKKE